MKIKDIFPAMHSQLAEAFTSTYEVNTFNNVKSIFKTDSGNYYSITTARRPYDEKAMLFLYRRHNIHIPVDTSGDVVNMTFGQINKHGIEIHKYESDPNGPLAPDDNPIKVFSTVFNFMKNRAERDRNEVIVYNFKGEHKLASLYKRMLERYPPSGYKILMNTIGDSTEFSLIREDVI